MKRKFPDKPILAVGGIIKSEGKILLVKRKNPPDKDLWSIPGGAVETGETLFQAVQREIKEECGVSVNNGKIIAIIDKIYRRREKIQYHYCIVDFLFEKFEGYPVSGSDALSLKFFDFKEILKSRNIPQSVKQLVIKIQSSQNSFPIYMQSIEK